MAVNKSSAKKKYSTGASKQVEIEMREMKRGKLMSGRSDKKVTNPRQAIAIGLSEARRAGKKVPPSPNKSASAEKAGTKEAAANKTPAKEKFAAKKTSTKKAASKKSAK